MTTRVTKWNHDRCLRSREVVDGTRKSHQTPPLVLNPLQFSELVRLAAVDDEQDLDDRVEKNRPKQDQEVESVSQASTVMKVPDKISKKVPAKCKPEDETASATSTTYGSIGSASFKTHNSLESRQRKLRDHSLRVDSNLEDKPSYAMNKNGQDNHLRSTQDGSLNNGKVSISSKSDTLQDYTFPGLEHTPEMKQLMALRTQLHAMKLQTKQQAQETAGESRQTREHPEMVPDNPHYTRWEPKLLHDEVSNKKLYQKWKTLRPRGHSQRKANDAASVQDKLCQVQDGIEKGQEVRSSSSVMSPTTQGDPNAGLDTYSKAVFQRGGEFEPEKIRKRYVYSKTYWLKGDGYDKEERGNWVQKPVPEYLSTYKVQPGDVRYCRRSRSATTLSSRHSTSSRADSKSTVEDKLDPNPCNEEGGCLHFEEHTPNDTEKKASGNRVKNRARCKSGVERKTSGERLELPHQRHHDFRRLKDIFSCPKPTYDRLQRDRETLTQHEKELLILQNMKLRAQQHQDAIKMAEEELRRKEEVTPGQRSAVLLKQVEEGRVQQLAEKARTLQERLQEERRWDRKVQLQQRQHLHHVQQKERHKADKQDRMRKALTKLVGERRAREHMEHETAAAERDKQRQQHLLHRQHQRALIQQRRAEKQEALRHLQEDLDQAMTRHDDLDLHYAVARRREYRARKRDKFLQRPPTPPLLLPPPHQPPSQEGGPRPNTSFFQTVGGQRD